MKYVGKDGYGLLVLVMAFVGTFNSITDFGFQTTNIKKVSEGNDPNQCISTYFTINLITTTVMVLITFSAIFIGNTYFNSGINGDKLNLYYLAILYYAFYGFTYVVTSTFVAKTQSAKAQLIFLIDPFIRIPLVILVCFYSPTVFNLLLAYAGVGLIVAIIALVMMSKNHLKLTRPALFRPYLKFAAPMALVTIVAASVSKLDSILIGSTISLDELANYSTVQTIMTMFAVIGTSVATLTYPVFSALHAKGDLESIRSLTNSAERYISILALPIAVLFVLFPSQILSIYNPSLAEAGDTLRVLTIATFLSLMTVIYNSQMLAVNRPDLSAKMNFFAIGITSTLMLIFVPPSLFGIRMLDMATLGAAIAVLISTLLVLAVTRIVVGRLTGTRTYCRILLHLASAIITATCLVVLNLFYPFSGFMSLIIYGCITLGVFSVTLYAMGELTKWDIIYLLDVINPKKMGSYISSELKETKEGKL